MTAGGAIAVVNGDRVQRFGAHMLTSH